LSGALGDCIEQLREQPLRTQDMTAELIDLSTLLQRDWCFRIPLYQRSYGWGPELCENLIEDVRHLQENPGAVHYLGNLVVKTPENGLDSYDVIDGQQRLTSLFLMLSATGMVDASEQGRLND
jgi:hypothetical protein